MQSKKLFLLALFTIIHLIGVLPPIIYAQGFTSCASGPTTQIPPVRQSANRFSPVNRGPLLGEQDIAISGGSIIYSNDPSSPVVIQAGTEPVIIVRRLTQPRNNLPIKVYLSKRPCMPSAFWNEVLWGQIIGYTQIGQEFNFRLGLGSIEPGVVHSVFVVIENPQNSIELSSSTELFFKIGSPASSPSCSISPPSASIQPGNKVTLSWQSVPNAVSYNVRLDDGTSSRYDDPRFETCSNSPHYYCENGITSTSITNIPIDQGITYRFWVDPIVPGCGYFNGITTFTVPFAPSAGPTPFFNVLTDTIRLDETVVSMVSNAAANADVSIRCSDPNSVERCDFYTPGRTDANGVFVDRRVISRAEIPGRWCAYALVAGNRSNTDCFNVQSTTTALPPDTRSIRVVSPNGGETWNVGSTQTILWTSTNVPVTQRVNLRLIGSGGSSLPLVLNSENDGFEQITVLDSVPSGTYQLEVSATIDASTTISDRSDSTLTITRPANRAPHITACALATPVLTVGATAVLNYLVSDPDGDALTVILNWGDGSSSTGSLNSASHIYSTSGSFNSIIIATDSRGATTSSLCALIPVGAGPGAGLAIPLPSLPPARIGFPYSATISPSGGTGRYSFSLSGSLPPGLIFNGPNCLGLPPAAACSATMTGTPLAAGIFPITITVTDGLSSISKAFSLEVSAGLNRPPVINAISGPSTIQVGIEATWNVIASDPDGNPLVYSLISGPSGMAIDRTSGLIRYLPSTIGSFSATISASDLTDSVQQSFTFTVVGPGAVIISPNRLAISDVDAKISGKKSVSVELDKKIRKDSEPGSSIEFKIRVKNNFSRGENIEIQNVQVKATLEGIASGEDLEQDSSSFDIMPQSEKTVTLKLKTPLQVNSGTYDILIEADGEDENGNTHSADFHTKLEIKKDKHNLKFLNFALSPRTITCGRNLNLDYKIINLGEEDEKNAVLEVKSEALGIDYSQKDLSIEADAENSLFSGKTQIKIDEDTVNGLFPLVANIYSDDNQLGDSKTFEVKVEDCARTREESEVVLITKGEDVPEAKKAVKQPIKVSNIIFSLKDGAKIKLSILVISIILTLFFILLVIVLFIKLVK
ncbi:MAG: PKD domain-containing protein [Nanoarchaeota archaeon]